MAPTATPLRVVSLFAGIGGFDLGFERAGHTTIHQVEYDQHATRVLEHHWPDVDRTSDIHDVPDGLLPDHDILVGGFPCQDYSVAGNRGGLAGDRGALWWEFHRLIDSHRPTWVVGENVPGLLSSAGGRDFRTIVGSLVQLGYGVTWAVLDSQYFGVAQRRRRVFIVGHAGGQPRPEVLALSEGMFGHPAPGRQSRETVAPTLASRTKGGGGLSTDFDLDGGLIVHATQDPVTDTDVAFALSATASQAVTVPSVRRLTPLECERLQGFPDNWTAMLSDTQRYKTLGNAVTVNVAEWIGRRLS